MPADQEERLDCRDAILVAVRAAGPGVLGRTTLQKILYLAKIKRLVDAEYSAHYYGPYSEEVFGCSQSLAASGFVEERVHRLPGLPRLGLSQDEANERTRYAYEATEDGKSAAEDLLRTSTAAQHLQDLIGICKGLHVLDLRTLAGATKVHYVLHHQHELMTAEEIRMRAKDFGWRLNSDEVTRVATLLVKLGFATSQQVPKSDDLEELLEDD